MAQLFSHLWYNNQIELIDMFKNVALVKISIGLTSLSSIIFVVMSICSFGRFPFDNEDMTCVLILSVPCHWLPFYMHKTNFCQLLVMSFKLQCFVLYLALPYLTLLCIALPCLASPPAASHLASPHRIPSHLA